MRISINLWLLDSFTSQKGSRVTLESQGGKYYLCIDVRTEKYDSSELITRRAFEDYRRSMAGSVNITNSRYLLKRHCNSRKKHI